VRTQWSDLVCFAGIGPGELFVGDRKLVGMSQRRTRAGARFQCALPRRWSPEPLRSLLRPAPAVGALDACGADVGQVPVEDLIDALVRALP
jgi:lipoate-protein ligase A